MCDVVVHVLDVNDNSPSFGSSVYNSTVSEGAATGTVLAMVNITTVLIVVIVQLK